MMTRSMCELQCAGESANFFLSRLRFLVLCQVCGPQKDSGRFDIHQVGTKSW